MVVHKMEYTDAERIKSDLYKLIGSDFQGILGEKNKMQKIQINTWEDI